MLVVFKRVMSILNQIVPKKTKLGDLPLIFFSGTIDFTTDGYSSTMNGSKGLDAASIDMFFDILATAATSKLQNINLNTKYSPAFKKAMQVFEETTAGTLKKEVSSYINNNAVEVTGDGVRLRSDPNAADNTQVLGLRYTGDTAILTGARENGYSQVIDGSGTVGWMSEEHLQKVVGTYQNSQEVKKGP